MLVGVFFGKNGGRAASGVAAEKKNLFFFLRSFPERMFREVNGVLCLRPRCAGYGHSNDVNFGVFKRLK
jgi:hypothetical protein